MQYKETVLSHTLQSFAQEKLIKVNIYSWYRLWYFIISRILPSFCTGLCSNIVFKFHTWYGVHWCERQTMDMESNVPR